MNRKLYFFILFIIVTISLSAQNNSFVLEFDGDDSFFINDRDDVLDIPGDDWTIECWVFPTAVTVPATNIDFPVIMSRKYSFELFFRNESGNLGFGIMAFGSSGGYSYEAIENSSSTMMLNAWHHIAVSSKKNTGGARTTKLFLDGIIVGTSIDVDFSLGVSPGGVNFGARYVNPSYLRYVDGCAMDELAYSNVARYTANFSIGPMSAPHTFDANTIFYYGLDEGAGTEVVDSSSNVLTTMLRSSPNTPTWRSWDYFAENLPLPVEYIKPLSVNSKNNSSLLKWSTASETNNEGFNIERSIDNSIWNTIAFIEGANNSNIVLNYQYLDKYPNEINYYRLKQVDFDGKYTISASVYLSFENKEAFSHSDVEIYPIPAKDKLFIKTNGIIEEIELREISGKFIKNIECINNAINTSNIIRGTYLLSMKIDGIIIVKKLIIIN